MFHLQLRTGQMLLVPVFLLRLLLFGLLRHFTHSSFPQGRQRGLPRPQLPFAAADSQDSQDLSTKIVDGAEAAAAALEWKGPVDWKGVSDVASHPAVVIECSRAAATTSHQMAMIHDCGYLAQKNLKSLTVLHVVVVQVTP